MNGDKEKQRKIINPSRDEKKGLNTLSKITGKGIKMYQVSFDHTFKLFDIKNTYTLFYEPTQTISRTTNVYLSSFFFLFYFHAQLVPNIEREKKLVLFSFSFYMQFDYEIVF